MLILVMIDLMPFITLFFIYILIFSVIIIIMDADVPLDDYEDLPRFVRIFIHTFRLSVGDIDVNKFGLWGSDDSWFS